jgi:hypothetical protein
MGYFSWFTQYNNFALQSLQQATFGITAIFELMRQSDGLQSSSARRQRENSEGTTVQETAPSWTDSQWEDTW